MKYDELVLKIRVRQQISWARSIHDDAAYVALCDTIFWGWIIILYGWVRQTATIISITAEG